MNTINFNAIAASRLSDEIDMRRGNALRSYFKRQSRRQVRHRLAIDLRMNMAYDIEEAVDMLAMGARDRNPVVTSAQVIAFPSQQQRALRSVVVVRKTARSPFERKHVQVELLAA